MNPTLLLIYGFGTLVSVGTLLLILPFAHRGEGFAPFVDAMFTAISAATVTGLVIQETSTYWTIPGQFVIMLLMFAGGLGIMTIVGVLLLVSGQRVSLTQRLVMRETIGTHAFADIMSVTKRIVLWAIAFQIVGFLVLFARFAGLYSTGDAAWHALFQSVSAFNNAGFTSIPDSANLSAFKTDRVILGAIAGLIVLGSLSYWVMIDVVRRRRFSTLRLNTKLVLIFSAGLILAGALVFLAFESGNSNTLGDLSVPDKLITSVFHSVNRTSGFSTMDFGQTRDETNVFYTALMFIGGASASVAGGIKVNTFAIIVLAVLATLRGKGDVTAFNRRIPSNQIRWAQALTIASMAGIFVLGLTLAAIEREYDTLALLFEAVSAFATVGFSTGITGELSTASQVLLAIGMFIGRVVPPMVIIVALSQNDGEEKVRHPTEGVLAG